MQSSGRSEEVNEIWFAPFGRAATPSDRLARAPGPGRASGPPPSACPRDTRSDPATTSSATAARVAVRLLFRAATRITRRDFADSLLTFPLPHDRADERLGRRTV